MTNVAITAVKKLRLALPILLFSMLAAVAFAQVGTGSYGPYSCNLGFLASSIQGEICSVWSGMFPIALVAVLLSFTIAAIIFMVGTATKLDRLRNFGIGELYEAIATALIVGSFFLISGLILQTIPSTLINNLGSAAGGTPSITVTDPYAVATNALLTTINETEWSYDCIINGNTMIGQDPALSGGVPNPPPSGLSGCPFVSGENVNLGGTAGVQFQSVISTDYAFVAAVTTQNIQINIGAGTGGTLALGLLTNGISLLELFAQIEYVFPEGLVASFLIDGLYVLWGIYYLLIFFSVIGPVFVILGIVFRAILPTRGLGGMLIALGMGFYLVAPTLLAFLYSPGVNPYPSNLNASACGGIINGSFIPSSCSLFGTILSVMNGLWLQIIFYPILTIAITYSFITQMANFIGASASTLTMRTFL